MRVWGAREISVEIEEQVTANIWKFTTQHISFQDSFWNRVYIETPRQIRPYLKVFLLPLDVTVNVCLSPAEAL